MDYSESDRGQPCIVLMQCYVVFVIVEGCRAATFTLTEQPASGNEMTCNAVTINPYLITYIVLKIRLF